MKKKNQIFKLKKLTLSLLIAGGLSATTLSFAATTNLSKQQLRLLINQIVNQRTAKLSHEVNQLQHQVVVLKHRLGERKALYPMPSSKKHPHHLNNTRNASIHDHYQPVPTHIADASEPTHPRYTPIHVQHPAEAANGDILTGIYLGGTPVFTSPFIGLHSEYDGSDLVVNASSINLDTRLLKQRQAMTDALYKAGFPFPHHPVVELSGQVAGQGISQSRSPGNTTSDIDLAYASFDVFVQANPWVSAFIALSYDNSRINDYRVSNSNITLDKGFVTIGNLNRSHLYGSLGQLYVPFGQFSSYMLSSTLPQLLGRTKARAAVFGIYPQGESGLYGATYIFHGDTRTDKGSLGGVNLGLKSIHGDLHSDIAVGVISNLADSQGMQYTGAPDSIFFGGFSDDSRAEHLHHSVPGFDAHGTFSFRQWSLIAEYVMATRSFDRHDLSFNHHGAKPQALHLEGIYHFQCYGKPGSFGISYGWTKEALALLLPKHRYMATVNYSFWRDTIASIEFRHDDNYAMTDWASGAGSPQFKPLFNHTNRVTFQFSVYF